MKFPEANIPIWVGGEPASSKIVRYYHRMRNGFLSPFEFMLMCIDRGIAKFFMHKFDIAAHFEKRRRIRELRASGGITRDFYRFKDIKLPIMKPRIENDFFHRVFLDLYYCYLYLGDDYHEEKINDLFYLLVEGPYGLINDKVNVTVEPGDIVIDAGSWIGDFAAYASAKGALTYAFEPTESTFEILNKTAELNKNIIPVKKGLSDENVNVTLVTNDEDNTGSNYLLLKPDDKMYQGSQVEVVRLDDFVRENKLERVDFIKSDIEGFERKLLAGAQDTLKNFAPKLALCTYHLPDDPEVIASLILQANPKYNIVQKREKLFASVPE